MALSSNNNQDMQPLLVAALGGAPISGLKRLSGGANMETWAFDCQRENKLESLIFRRLPTNVDAEAGDAVEVSEISIETEAKLLEIADQYQVLVPKVKCVLQAKHQLGRGYIMSREPGEALPFRLLADQRYAQARENLAYECGQMLARIHQIPLSELPAEMVPQTLFEELDQTGLSLDRYGNTSPVHQLALSWLRDNAPASPKTTLVHGDFRNGNLLVNEQGLVAVLDWELAHIGNPIEDLGYFCTNVWRFGRTDKPAGGVGSYAQLLDGYRSVMGDAPEQEELHYWEVLSTLKWGLCCEIMLSMYQDGTDRSLERAAIGRRMSESEIDLLLLLENQSWSKTV